MTTSIRWSGIKRNLLALAAVALLAALLAACGGDSNDDDDDSSGAAAETPATASSGASSNPTAAASTPSTGGNAPSANSAALSNLNSYKYTMKVTGNGGPLADISGQAGLPGGSSASPTFEFSGAYIKPDKAETTITIANFETSTVIIGNQQWNTFAGQTQGPLPATASDVEDANVLAGFWDGQALSGRLKDFKCGGKESVNGVSAQKCTAERETLQRIASEEPAFVEGLDATTITDGNADVWLADEGYPVRMRMNMSGKDNTNADFSLRIEMDVTDINGNFQITPPKS